MFSYGVIISVLIGLNFITCSMRERSNPLDPKNPDTGGKPSDIKVVSLKNDITVSWDPIQSVDVEGYNIYRRKQGESSLQKIDFIPLGINSYKDTGFNYDQEVLYALSIIAPGYESPLSDSVSITPGPYEYWAADLYGGGGF